MMARLKHLARGNTLQFAMLAAMRMGISFSQLVIVLVAGSLLDKSDFGRFVIIYAGARLLASFAGLGAPSFLLKDVPYRQAQNQPWQSARSAALTFAVYPAAICVAVGALAEAIGATGTPFYPLSEGEGAVMAGLGFCWAGMLALGAYVRVTRTPTQAMMIADLFTPATMLASLVLMQILNWTSLLPLVLTCCTILILAQLIMLMWHAAKKWMPIGGANAAPVKLRALIPYWGTVILNTASTQIDILIAGSLAGPVATGVYTIIKRITNVLALPMSIAIWILAPRVSRASATDDRAALDKAARTGIGLAFLPALALAILVAVSSPWWFAYFDIAWGGEALALLGILLFANLLSVAFGPSIMFATQTGMPQVAVRSLSLAVLTAGAWMIIGGSIAGVIAIAIGQVIMYICINVPIRLAVKKRFGFDYSLAAFIPQLKSKHTE
ncbi:MAG: hypothetical protein ABJP70_02890 [Erythrobacter sp.]